MKKVDDDFKLVDLPSEAQDPEIKEEDFVLKDASESSHEQRFQTKPTTFFKDSMRRFAKNKSSVVAAVILGILVVLSIIVPLASPYRDRIDGAQDAALVNLEPKLFNSGTGFWDGTKKVEHVSIDEFTGLPDPDTYPLNGIVGGKDAMVVTAPEYTSVADKFGFDGYALVGFYGSMGVNKVSLRSTNPFEFDADLASKKFTLNLDEVSLVLTNFDVCDLDKIRYYEDDDTIELPRGYTLGLTSLEFNYYDVTEKKYVPVTLVEPALTHDIDEYHTVDIESIIVAETGLTSFDKFYFTISVTPVEGTASDANVCGLVKNMMIYNSRVDEPFTPTELDPVNPHLPEIEYFSTNLTSDLHGICFDNAMTFIARRLTIGYGANVKQNRGYWSISSSRDFAKEIFLGKCRFASFTFDSYAATLGNVEKTIYLAQLANYKNSGWISLNYDWDLDIYDRPYVTEFEVHIKNREKCPLVEDLDLDDVIGINVIGGKPTIEVRAKVTMWKFLEFDSMPKFLMGTDRAGRAMFTYVFEGLRNSLLLGLLTFVVCFLFGLIWGAISGYFGGNVDLAMERLTDILSGMPWIVVMTIIVMHMGRNFTAFAIALCLTGWIGTASTTRTQFYRFRGREYVLASRTLGASDARLIAKHILPNAMGTIITGAVLMIPSVIFSEATLAYLGLGFQDHSSLGVILSANQAQLFNHPYQLIFPSVIISLLMISFNLFGNGLRDAINPSLKGEGE